MKWQSLSPAKKVNAIIALKNVFNPILVLFKTI